MAHLCRLRVIMERVLYQFKESLIVKMQATRPEARPPARRLEQSSTRRPQRSLTRIPKLAQPAFAHGVDRAILRGKNASRMRLLGTCLTGHGAGAAWVVEDVLMLIMKLRLTATLSQPSRWTTRTS